MRIPTCSFPCSPKPSVANVPLHHATPRRSCRVIGIKSCHKNEDSGEEGRCLQAQSLQETHMHHLLTGHTRMTGILLDDAGIGSEAP